jgi:hypothetical protein
VTLVFVIASAVAIITSMIITVSVAAVTLPLTGPPFAVTVSAGAFMISVIALTTVRLPTSVTIISVLERFWTFAFDLPRFGIKANMILVLILQDGLWLNGAGG